MTKKKSNQAGEFGSTKGHGVVVRSKNNSREGAQSQGSVGEQHAPTARIDDTSEPQGRSLNLFQFTLLVLGIATLLLTGVAAYTALQASRIRSAVVEADVRAAMDELEIAVESITNESRSQLRAVARWDALRKQLRAQLDYPFWWRSTLMNPARIPHYVQDIEVYDHAGARLDTGMPSSLPDRVPSLRTFARKDEHGSGFFDFITVHDDTGGASMLGYLGIRLDLNSALTDLPSYNAVVPSRLTLRLPDADSIESDRLPDYIGYDVPSHTRLTPLVRTVNRAVMTLVTINILILIAGIWLVHRYLIKPLRGVEQDLVTLRSGHAHNALGQSPIRVREIRHLRIALGEYQREIDQLKARLNREKGELWDLAHLDSLTGSKNRLAFDRDWDALLNSQDARHSHVTCMMFDCDRLKALNDAYGHDTGDRIIQTVAQVIRETLRDEDRLYRVGGDEFIAILMDLDSAGAAAIAQRCRQAINAYPPEQMQIDSRLSVSVGFASARWPDRSALAELPRQADEAMYRSKHTRPHTG